MMVIRTLNVVKKSGMKNWYMVFVLMICWIATSFAQTPAPLPPEQTDPEGRIESAVNSFVESHRHKIGIFRIRPTISFQGGLDTNAAFGDDAETEDREDDFFLSATPALSVGLKFGLRAYFRLLQQIPFVYYRENDDRSGIFTSTDAEFVTGSSKVLATLSGNHTTRNTTLNEELDEPIQYTSNSGGFRVEHALGYRTELSHLVTIDQTNFELEQSVDSLLTLTDRRTLTLGTGTNYLFNERVSLVLDVNFRRSEALDTEEETQAWGLLGGLQFHRTRLNGFIQAGYGGTISELQEERNNFIIDASLDGLVGKTLMIGGFVSRNYQFSVLDSDATRLTTQGGMRFQTGLNQRLSLSGSFTIGENDYGDQLIAGIIVDQDTFQKGDIGVSIAILKYLSVRPGLFYLRRETSIPELDKETYGYSVSLAVGHTIEF